MGGTDDEFPLLSALGLYAADIRGDGNCLFNALSDQLYGHQDQHTQIRARVIDYMREHANYYKQFIEVHPGGGIRRNPKRKNAGGYSSSTSKTAAASQPLPPPSPAAVDRVFESHLARMARGGTYGDHLEISAFAAAFATDVKIYQRDFAYVVSPPTATTTAPSDDNDPLSTITSSSPPRPTAHIAYHLWEHYSSIRNLGGPHSGPPCVTARVLTEEEERQQKEKLAQTPAVLPWQIDIVAKSLPFLADKPTIKRALEAARGNIDLAVSRLLDADEDATGSGGSTSRSFSSGGEAASWQGSSSVERDAESEYEENGGEEADGLFGSRGRKKQDRRLSRASRRGGGGGLGLHHPGTGHGHLTHLAPLSAASRESLHSAVSGAGTDESESGGGGGGDAASFTFSFTSSQPGSSTQPSSVEDFYASSTSSPASTVKPSGSSFSSATSTAQPGFKPTVRLKLLPPKKSPPPPATTTIDLTIPSATESPCAPTFTANSAAVAAAAAATSKHAQPPRIAARDKKSIKKLAQKAARKERQQISAGVVLSPGGTTAKQLPLRQGPPPPTTTMTAMGGVGGGDGGAVPGGGGHMETLRTLYI